MATTTSLRSRRNAAQIRALATLEPHVRGCDPTWRRKYLQDYCHAFRSYECVLEASEFQTIVAGASIVLVGDYHALPACQQFAAEQIMECTRTKRRPAVLAVETVFSRDQHILDEWCRGEICEDELRQRIRFDLDWGYDWNPFYELLSTAHQHGDAVFGLDCMPREDLRRIGIRDRHAVHKLAEIRERHPDAIIIALIGESHLAPEHLPSLIQKQLPKERVVSILQNVDALYWRATLEQDDVRAVRVNDHTVCVFNSTPFEKYESYRVCLDRWRNDPQDGIDFAPAIYDLINSLLQFLDINRYSPRSGTQPKLLIDLLPEVYGPSMTQFRKLLSRRSVSDEEAKLLSQRIERRGCLYLPQFNVFVAGEFRTAFAAEEAARFVQHACQGLGLNSRKSESPSANDGLQREVLERALVHLGSRILWQVKLKANFAELSPKYGNPSPSNNPDSSARAAGDALGVALYQALSRGDLTRTDLRRLFLFSIREPGRAEELCSQLQRRLRPTF